jgi:hypothetical protein
VYLSAICFFKMVVVGDFGGPGKGRQSQKKKPQWRIAVGEKEKRKKEKGEGTDGRMLPKYWASALPSS